MPQKLCFRRSAAIAVSLMFLLGTNQITNSQTAGSKNETFMEMAQGAVIWMGGRFDKNRMPLERFYTNYKVVKELAPPSAEDIDSLEAGEFWKQDKNTEYRQRNQSQAICGLPCSSQPRFS